MDQEPNKDDLIKQKVEEAMKLLNPTELFQIMSDLAASLLTGEQPEMSDVYIKLTIPTSILNVVSNVSKKFDLNPEEMLSKMASEGFSTSIKTVTNMATSTIKEEEKEVPAPLEEAEALKQLAPGFEKILASFGQLNGLTEQLKNLEGMLKVYDDK